MANDTVAVLRMSVTWVAVLWICVAALVFSTLLVVIRTYTPVPKWDYWGEVYWLKQYYAGHWHVSDLWRQHNEHRIFFPRLFFLIDWGVFKGTSVFLLVSMLLLHGAHAWIFVREIHIWKGLSRTAGLAVSAIVVALFFSGANLENFTWPFQISFIMVFCAGTCAILCLIRYAETMRVPTLRMAGIAWLGASIGAATVASYSLASGVLIWPVLLLLAVALRLLPRILLLIVAIMALIGFLYLSGYHAVDIHTDVPRAVAQPFKIVTYVCAYLALPLSKINHYAGVFAGFAGLLFISWESLRLFRRQALPRLVMLSIGVMLFIALGAVVTALGRMSLGPPEAAMRYATPASIFWACALLLVLCESGGRQLQPGIRTAVSISAAITCLITVVLPLHIEQAGKFTKLGVTFEDAESALLAGVSANDEIKEIFPDPTFVFDHLGVLQTHRLSLFAGDPVGMGESLQTRYRLTGKQRCEGSWDVATVISGATKVGEAVSGWAWDRAADQRPKMILITDDSSVIRGLAKFTRSRNDVAISSRNSRMETSGWYGFVQIVPLNQQYRAYALLNDGKSVCAFDTHAQLQGTMYAVFRHSRWLLDTNRSGKWESTDQSFDFGFDGDYPVVGDWDGTGVVRAGVFRKGEWYLDMNNSGRWDQGDRRVLFGVPGDHPIVGDWNHSGTSKFGVFRNGTWILDWNGDQKVDASRQFHFGLPGDTPVVGDWDNSGNIRIGVFRRGEWYLDMNGDFQFDGRDKKVLFGLPGDQPVTGDWSGLGVTGIGVFRNGQWILDTNGNMQWDPQDRSIFFGLPGDIAIPWK
jgi:hypothetical protein